MWITDRLCSTSSSSGRPQVVQVDFLPSPKSTSTDLLTVDLLSLPKLTHVCLFKARLLPISSSTSSSDSTAYRILMSLAPSWFQISPLGMASFFSSQEADATARSSASSSALTGKFGPECEVCSARNTRTRLLPLLSTRHLEEHLLSASNMPVRNCFVQIIRCLDFRVSELEPAAGELFLFAIFFLVRRRFFLQQQQK